MPAQPQPEPEHDLWHGRYSPKAMYGTWFGALLVSIAGVVLAVIVPVAWIAVLIIVPMTWIALLFWFGYRRLVDEYTLTSQRFLHPHGVLSRVSNQILLVDVDDISYQQSLLGRMLGYGTITLLANDMSIQAADGSKGKADGRLTLVPVDDVERVANLIDQTRREERRKRAIYMAQA